MRNVTITLDDETAGWARVRAAELDTSVSKLVGQMLREHMERARGGQRAEVDRAEYDKAMKEFFALPRRPLTKPGEKYPTRDEVHDCSRR